MTLGDPAAGAAGRTATATGRLARLGFADARAAERDLAPVRAGRAGGGRRPAARRPQRRRGPGCGARRAGRACVEAADSRAAGRHCSRPWPTPTSRPSTGWSPCSARASPSPTTWPATPTTGRCSGPPSDDPPEPEAARRELLVAVGAAPEGAEPVAVLNGTAGYEALRQTYRRRLLTIAARDLTGLAGFEPTAAALAELAGATLEAALAIARSELPDGVRAVPARGRRHGQVRRSRAELRQRRRRPLRRRAAAGRRRDRGARDGDPAGHRAHAGLLGLDGRGRDLAGRRGAASRGPAGCAGPHAGVLRRLLRPVGQHLGVPGPAQGTPGGW